MTSTRLVVKSNVKRLRRDLKVASDKVVAKASRVAINETAALVRRESVDDLSSKLRLPKSLLKFRYDAQGKRKGNRISVNKATARRNWKAVIEIWVRGLLVLQNTTGRQLKSGGVKARGRFYQGAFIANVQGRRLALKRVANRFGLVAPKIGVREAFDVTVREKLFSTKAQREFDRRWTRVAKAEIAKQEKKSG